MPSKAIFALTCLAVGSFALGLLSVTGQHHLHAATLENLSTAMHREAFARAKYLLFAQHAQQEETSELASLFTSIANTGKSEHFAEQARMAGTVGSDVDNLKNSIADESYTAELMYPNFAAAADRLGDHEAALRFRDMAADEARHRDSLQVELSHIDKDSGTGAHSHLAPVSPLPG